LVAVDLDILKLLFLAQDIVTAPVLKRNEEAEVFGKARFLNEVDIEGLVRKMEDRAMFTLDLKANLTVVEYQRHDYSLSVWCTL
jgi:hypothetical protein